jgi:hypothetical protein
MPALLPPPTIGRCSASSRSFLRGPDGPAGAPPGQTLRSGALIEPRENREQKQDPYYKVSTVTGEPRERLDNVGARKMAACRIRIVSLASVMGSGCFHEEGTTLGHE